MSRLNKKLLIFKEYVNLIENDDNRLKFIGLLEFVTNTFPHLETVIKWRQPKFTDHDTYIIAFNATKKHTSSFWR